MAKSLSVMQNYGCLLLDEVDLIMHPLHSELNFPIGAKTLLQPAPYRWEIVVHLMDAIFFATTGAMSDDTYLVKGKPVLRAIKRAIEQGKELKTILTSPSYCASRRRLVLQDYEAPTSAVDAALDPRSLRLPREHIGRALV
jgi:hypothetical protein